MAYRWRADDGPTLNDGMFFFLVIIQGIRTSIAGMFFFLVVIQGIRTSIAKKPYIL